MQYALTDKHRQAHTFTAVLIYVTTHACPPQPHLKTKLFSFPHAPNTVIADVRSRSPRRSRCWRVCPCRPAAVKAAQIWHTAATTWAGSPGVGGTVRATGSDLWPRPSERRMCSSRASPCPESAPPSRHGRTCPKKVDDKRMRWLKGVWEEEEKDIAEGWLTGQNA